MTDTHPHSLAGGWEAADSSASAEGKASWSGTDQGNLLHGEGKGAGSWWMMSWEAGRARHGEGEGEQTHPGRSRAGGRLRWEAQGAARSCTCWPRPRPRAPC